MDMLFTVSENVWAVIVKQAPWMIGLGIVFTALSFLSSQSCNPGKVWWKSKDLVTDIINCFATDLMAPYVGMIVVILIMLVLHGAVLPDDIDRYFAEGNGLVSAWPLWAQVAFYMLASDFLLYWSHRIFHKPRLWYFHAVHHAPEDLDWTAMYRVHPVNRMFGGVMVEMIMLGMGVPPAIAVALIPFNIITAAWVHSNLNWTLGPLKYVLATPVFHRWHHTGVDEGGKKNYAPTFSFWDVLFGTFYMPAGKLPSNYGVDDPNFPRDFVGQMIAPFILFGRSFKRTQDPVITENPAVSSAEQ